MLPLGTICYITHSSVTAMSYYNKYKDKLALKCPCHIGNTEQMVITDHLPNKLIVVELLATHEVAILHENDVVRL